MAKRGYKPDQLGLFKPDTNWTRPAELPDLRRHRIMALDTETKDEGISSGRGAGWALGPAGYLCGVAAAVEGAAYYFPVRHPDTDCFPQEVVLRWVDDHAKAGVEMVLHNSSYDVGWLGSYGVAPPPLMQDTLPAAVMIDEGRTGHEPFSLDSCCAWQGIPGKDKSLLAEAVRAYGGDPARPVAHLWQLPARYVGPYAEQDGTATLDLWSKLKPQLVAQGLWDAYRTEMELIPMVVAMRRRGIRIDTRRLAATAAEFRRRRDAALREITDHLGGRRLLTIDDVRNQTWLERTFQAESISFPRTEKTHRGSFSKDWMPGHPHWLPRAVNSANMNDMFATKFVENFLGDYAHRGRVHAEINQFLNESGGTRSHRFSYSNPALQQMPSPDKDQKDKVTKLIIPETAVGTPIRELFLPEEGEFWAAPDFSGQEVRITIHFADVCRCAGVSAVVEQFHRDPYTDYHQMVADMTGKPRHQAKIINFGLAYGKGAASLSEDLGVSRAEGDAILADYHARLPYIKALGDLCKRRAGDRGFIRLIDGARMHYNLWEGPYLEYEERRVAERSGKRLNPCTREEALARQDDSDHPWSKGRLRRADTRKAMNNLIQGSAARQTKIAMLRMWREGVTPLLQIHDEIGFSAKSEAEVKMVERIMIEATPLSVPVVVDAEVGSSWGNAKLSWDAAVAKYGAPTSQRPAFT